MKELKFGESGWFRTRGGEIVFACRVSNAGGYCVRGSDRCGLFNGWSEFGKWRIGFDNELDLVERLPECTGFDWKPKPKYVPWTFETMPVAVKVKSKSSSECHVVVPCDATDALCVQGHGISYSDLLSSYSQIDGTPCGVPQ